MSRAITIAVVVAALLALGGHMLVVNGLEDRIESLSEKLEETTRSDALSEANTATLELSAALTRDKLERAKAEQGQADQAARDRVAAISQELAKSIEKDRKTADDAEAMNRWLSELF